MSTRGWRGETWGHWQEANSRSRRSRYNLPRNEHQGAFLSNICFMLRLRWNAHGRKKTFVRCTGWKMERSYPIMVRSISQFTIQWAIERRLRNVYDIWLQPIQATSKFHPMEIFVLATREWKMLGYMSASHHPDWEEMWRFDSNLERNRWNIYFLALIYKIFVGEAQGWKGDEEGKGQVQDWRVGRMPSIELPTTRNSGEFHLNIWSNSLKYMHMYCFRRESWSASLVRESLIATSQFPSVTRSM